MNHPLYQIFHKIDQLERLLKWLIELSGYEVNILPRAIIEGQALVDFVVEMSFSKGGQLDLEKINNTKSDQATTSWVLHVDRAINSNDAKVG